MAPSRESRLAGVALAVLSGATLAPRIARADDAAEAQLHFQLGATEFRDHHYTEALGHFLAANRLAPTANTIFNVAQTYLVLQRDVEAYRFLRDYLQHPGATDANLAIARAAIERIEPHLARIEVVTDPPGATIFVDRTDVGDVGTTPRVLAVPAGPHELIVRMPGRDEQHRTVTAEIGQTARVEMTLETIVGNVQIDTLPLGATVLVDGHDAGVTPFRTPLPPGIHRLVLRHEGYLDVSREVEVRANQVAVLDERLPVDLARSGVISVTSAPSHATVRFRGIAMGQTPLSASAVRPGPGVLEVERRGRAPLRTNVFIRVGHEETVRAILGRPGAHRPYWIHTAGALGAAGIIAGIALGAFALTSHSEFDQSPSRDLLERTNSLNLACDISLISGLVVLAGGVTAYLLTPDPSQSRASVGDEVLRGTAR